MRSDRVSDNPIAPQVELASGNNEINEIVWKIQLENQSLLVNLNQDQQREYMKQL